MDLPSKSLSESDSFARVYKFTFFSGRPDSDIWPPCAPAELSNTRFYDALAGPTWMTNSTDFGHADMSEPAVLKHVQEVGLCASNTSVDVEDDIYRIAAGGKIVAFLRGEAFFKSIL